MDAMCDARQCDVMKVLKRRDGNVISLAGRRSVTWDGWR